MPRICVLGLGYVGLPTASLLATRGFEVLGVDVQASVVEAIHRGEAHLHEPELDVLVRSAVSSGNLRAAAAPAPAEVFLIAVPTPLAAGRLPDVGFVDAAAASIAPHLRAGDLVILESTSPVGTTERVHRALCAARPDLVDDGVARFSVAHCPERVLPGHILRELVENDRVVGGVDPRSTEAAAAFYRSFVSGRVIPTDARTAELCKLAENACRDVNLAFANELSMVCHELGVDVGELIRLANHHPRVAILQPGPGVGGHCVAVDPWFVVASAPEQTPLIRTAREVNLAKADWVVQRTLERARRFREPVVACLGLAYKADIGDLRESPALEITRRLRAELGGRVLACDPNLRAFTEFPLVPAEQAIAEADVVLALVAHRAFRSLDRAVLQERVVIDTCGAFR